MLESKKVVFFELNEVPWKVLQHFAVSFPNSSIARLLKSSRSYETYAEDSGHLSPWITWPTLHRGVTNDAHEISDFGMDLSRVNREYAPLWDILSRRGARVGVFGSLHSHPLPDNVEDYAFYVPDTFAASPECFPKRYEAFQEFNLSMAGMNGRSVSSGIALKEAVRFVAAAPSLGLRGRTVGKLAAQVFSERRNKRRLVRRRTSQVQIAFDFYLKALMRENPDISFFFTNHVASSMHRYWPALFPEDYETLVYDDAWRDKWSDEIMFTMREAAYQIGALMKYARTRPGTVLIVASSMGQAAIEGRMKIERTVVLTNFRKFMTALGFSPDEWEKRPAMVPQYNVRISGDAKDRFIAALDHLIINGKRFTVRDLGEDVIRLNIFRPNVETAEVTYRNERRDAAEFGIENIDLQDAAGSNAYHIPQGSMLVYDPEEPAHERHHVVPISTRAVAPSILKNFNVDRPSYMEAAEAL